MKRPTKLISQALVTQASTEFRFPFSIGLVIHFISNLQVIFLIFQPTLNSTYAVNLRALKFIRSISAHTVGFDIFNPPTDATLIKAVWYIICVYLFIFSIVWLYTFYQCARKRKISPVLSSVMGIVHFLHAKILFCPIHYYLIWVTAYRFDCDESEALGDAICGVSYFAMSVIFITINGAISVMKELLPRQSKNFRDSFAIKNNHFYQAILLHKTTLVIFLMTLQSSKFVLSTFNFLFPLLYCSILLTSLPYYNMLTLKINLFFASCHTTFSLILMIIFFEVDPMYLEAVSAILLAFLTKSFMAHLNRTVLRILALDFRTPQEAAHAIVLIKYYTKEYYNITKLGERHYEDSLYLYGVLKLYNIDATTLDQFGIMSEYEFQIYSVIVGKLEALLKVRPKSEILILLIAKIYFKKLKNSSKAISLLAQYEATGVSTRTEAAIKEIYSKLEKIYCKVHSDEELEILTYFNHRDNVNKLKEHIQDEISKHLAMWRELSNDTIHVKEVSDLAQQIDGLNIIVTKTWNGLQKTLDKQFVTPMLMYAAYQEVVRKNGQMARRLFRTYEEARKNKSSFKDKFSPFDDEIAVVLGSIESDNPGVVTDASASVQSLFNITREKLIGQKIDIILPRAVARKHAGFIRKYNRESRYDLNSQFDTYIKTIEGHFYPVDVKLKIYPYISRGLNIISHVRKLRERELLFIIDPKGTIVDCSEDLYDILNLTKRDLDFCKAYELSPELQEIEDALTLLYGSGKDLISHYKDDNGFGASDEKLELEKGSEIDLRSPSPNPNLTEVKSQTSTTTPLNRPHQKIDQTQAMTRSDAEEICRKYKKGLKLMFYPRSRPNEHSAPKDQIEFKIVVTSYILEGELYKIVKVKNVYFEPNPQEEGEKAEAEQDKSLAIMLEVKPSPDPSEDHFAEEFPADKERSFVSSAVEERFVVKEKPAKKYKSTAKLENLQKVLINNLDKGSMDQSLTKDDHMQFIDHAKGGKDDTSSLTYSHKESRIAKALNDLFQAETMRPLTRVTVLVVYFAMFVVVLLATINYVFSSKSFGDMKEGVLIVNTASYRILYSMVAWQYSLIYYSRVIRLRPIGEIFYTGITEIHTAAINMLTINKELEDKLATAGDNDLLHVFFNQSLSFWQPSSNQTFTAGTIDSFTGTQVLAQKYLVLSNYNVTLNEYVYALNGQEDFLFLLNNTANDYLVRSEEQVSKAETIVNNIIATNQGLIVVLLALEMTALAFVGFSLFLVARVIIHSYKKLFRVITRIHPENFTQRLSELVSMKEWLNKDLEAKDFTVRIDALPEMKAKQTKKSGKQKLHTRYREDKFILRSLVLYILKFLVIGILLVLGISGMFLLSFFTSDTTFTSLKLINERLSISHQLGYTFNMILGNFYFTIIFQNQTNYLMRFHTPINELDDTLEHLSLANARLLAILPDPHEGITDPLLEAFLRTDACRFLDSSLMDQCATVTKGRTLGLLGLNTKYYQNNLNYVNQYKLTPTFDDASSLLVDYANEVNDDLGVLPDAYEFLRSYLLDDFNTKVDTQKAEGLVVFVIVLLSMLIATLVIQLVTIRKFKGIDVAIRKILKIIPFTIIQENRLFGFYLKMEFSKEMESIKQFI